MDGDDQLDEELLCQETLDERGKIDALHEIADFTRIRTFACYDPAKVDEYVRSMVQQETTLGSGTHQRFVVSENLVKLHRPQAISWIAKTKGSFGFRFQAACLSVMCFDRYLSRRAIPDVNLMAHRPSAIAAAATMVAAGPSLSRHALESRMNPFACPDFPDIEFQCYELMRRLGMSDLPEPNRLKTPKIWSNTARPVSTSNDFWGTSSTTCNRRRLEFGRPDQDKGQPDQ